MKVLSDEDISAALDPTSATWVEITNINDLVTYPRQKLNAVPYAMKAGSVDNSSTSATPLNTGEARTKRKMTFLRQSFSFKAGGLQVSGEALFDLR